MSLTKPLNWYFLMRRDNMLHMKNNSQIVEIYKKKADILKEEYIILKKAKLTFLKINSAYRIQKWYKAIIYNPEHNFCKRLIENGKNNLQNFI